MTVKDTGQRLKIAERMFLTLGIDMGRKDTQYPYLTAEDRDKFLDEMAALLSSEVVAAIKTIGYRLDNRADFNQNKIVWEVIDDILATPSQS